MKCEIARKELFQEKWYELALVRIFKKTLISFYRNQLIYTIEGFLSTTV